MLRNECLDWEEDILPLLESVNYEEAVSAWVMDSSGTDVQSLESAIEIDNYWGEFLEEDIIPKLGQLGDDLDEWLDADSERDKQFRELVFERLYKTSEMEELCRELQIDTDDFRDEVYEHWLVSSWLARKLKERGETVGDLCGMTIWGRTCTGMSIALDGVIQRIAIELWQEEWDEFVKSQENITC